MAACSLRIRREVVHGSDMRPLLQDGVRRLVNGNGPPLSSCLVTVDQA